MAKIYKVTYRKGTKKNGVVKEIEFASGNEEMAARKAQRLIGYSIKVLSVELVKEETKKEEMWRKQGEMHGTYY